ncbi:aminotransferase class III-fold pyridoxal phosphate-dependent enzyme [Clostridiaceae bacterium 35-E11]
MRKNLIKCIELVQRDDKVIAKASRAPYFPLVMRRGKGLSIGVELVKNKLTKEKDIHAASKICYRCWEKGVILIFLAENILRVHPPLVITAKEVEQALDIIENTI